MRRYISARGNVSHFPSGVEKKLVFERDVKASKLTGNTSISSVNNIMSTERFFHPSSHSPAKDTGSGCEMEGCFGKIDSKVECRLSRE